MSMTGQTKMKFHKTSVNIASDVYDVLSNEAKKNEYSFYEYVKYATHKRNPLEFYKLIKKEIIMNKENTTPTTAEKEVVNQDQIRVFKSNNKKTERSPDFWGKLNIGEAEYEIAMWNNVSKAGNTYLSGFVSEAEDTDQAEVEELF